MSIRWPYCRDYEVNSEYGRHNDFHERYNETTKQTERTPIYHARHSCVVHDQKKMDEKVRKVCDVFFGMLAIGALIGISYYMGTKYK